MESGREVTLKATAKFRCHWSLSLAASGEWRKKVRGGREMIPQGQNDLNQTTYWVWEQ